MTGKQMSRNGPRKVDVIAQQSGLRLRELYTAADQHIHWSS